MTHNPATPSGVPKAAAPTPGGKLEVILLAYPLIITMGAEAMMGVIDTIFMGWVERAPVVLAGVDASGLQALGAHLPASSLVGTAQQGAVGLAAVLAWTLLSLVTGTLTGVTPFVAQNKGSGNEASCARYTWQGIYVSLPGAVYAALLALFAAPLIGLIGPTPDVAPYAADYLAIRCAGAVFIFLNWAILGFYRGIGDTMTPMWVTLGSVVLNVPLNYVFVFGAGGIPAMGPEGAALATVIASAAATLVYFALFLGRTKNARYGTRRAWRPSGEAMRKLALLGMPIGATWLLEMGSWTVFTVFVSKISEPSLAAHGIVLQLMHFSFLPGVALLITATTLVGQYVGEGSATTAERAGRTCLRLGVAYMAVMAAIFILLRGPLLSVFSRDPAVFSIATELILIMAVAQIFDAIGLISAGAVRGAGDTRYPMLVGMGSAWLIFVPGVYLFGNGLELGVHGAWVAVTLYLAVQAGLLYRRFRGGSWKRMKRLSEPNPVPGQLTSATR